MAKNTQSQSLSLASVQSDSRVRLFDSDGPVTLYSYTSCSDSDPEFVKNCRGVVFNGETLIYKGMGYIPETTTTQPLPSDLMDVTQCRFFKSYEGTTIRVFYTNDKWYISTHKKLDAYRSSWSSQKSFGIIFEEAVNNLAEENSKFNERLQNSNSTDTMNRFFDSLDKTHQYVFMVLNTPENRIVCDAPNKPTFYHIGTYVSNVLDLDDNIDVPHPEELLKVDSFRHILHYVDNLDISQYQGVIVSLHDKFYKILNDRYHHYSKARGNEMSIKYRYLQVRMDRELSQMLCELYPQYENEFDTYENILYDVCKNIYNAYRSRHIYKEFATLPPDEYSIMKKAHSWHLEDRQKNKISLRKVQELVNEENPNLLNRIVRRYLQQEQQTLQSQPESQPEPQPESQPESQSQTPENN
jgi:hypothetical protein